MKLRACLEKIGPIIDHIEAGHYLDKGGLLVKPPGLELTLVGPVASLSFAPLVVFTGLARGAHAVNTARQSRVNTTTPNSYFKALTKYLDDYDTAEPKTKKDDKFLLRIFKAIAKSWNTVSGAIENGCCAAFRGAKKWDVYFRGQDLYNIDDMSLHPKVKRYGSDVWEELTFEWNK